MDCKCLLSPYTVGYTVFNQERHGEQTVIKQDGLISSSQAFILLLTLGISLSLAGWLTIKPNPYMDLSIIHIFLIIYLMASAIVLQILSLRNNHTKELYVKEPQKIRPMEGGIFKRFISWMVNMFCTTPAVFGMVFAFIVCLPLEIIQVICTISCMRMYTECGILSKNLTWTFLVIAKVIFQTTLTVFCVRFKERVFLRCAPVRYSFLLVVATSAIMWFRWTLYDAFFITDGNDIHQFNCTIKSKPSSVKACFWSDNEHSSRVHSTIHLLFPLNIQFIIMSTKIILKLFFGMKDWDKLQEIKQDITDIEQSQNEDQNLLAVAPESGAVVKCSQQQCLQQSTSESSLDSNNDDGSSNFGSKLVIFFCKSQSFFKWIALFFFVGQLLVLACLHYMYFQGYDWYENVYRWSELGSEIILFCMCLLGHSVIPRTVGDFHRKYSGLEMLILISSFGYGILKVLRSAATFNYMLEPEVFYARTDCEIPSMVGASFLLVTELTEFVYIYYQTGFLFLAIRIYKDLNRIHFRSVNQAWDGNTNNTSINTTVNAYSRESPQQTTWDTFYNVVVFLALFNLLDWFIKNILPIVLLREEKCQLYIQYYGHDHWHMVTSAMKPLMLFYKFNCGTVLLAMYLNRKQM